MVVTLTASPGAGVLITATQIAEDLDYYPNPVVDELNIQLPRANDEILHCSIANSLGQILEEEEILSDNGAKATLPVQSLPAGLYFLIVQTKEKTITEKIVKE